MSDDIRNGLYDDRTEQDKAMAERYMRGHAHGFLEAYDKTLEVVISELRRMSRNIESDDCDMRLKPFMQVGASALESAAKHFEEMKGAKPK